MNQTISIIMACHNAADHLQDAVECVWAQTHDHWELIVIDDGSTDTSPALLTRIAHADPERIKVLRQGNSGPYPARNRGLREARGDWIAFLDADDWWAPTFIERMMASVEDGRIDIAYCGWQNVGREATESQPYVPPAYEDEDTVAQFLGSCPWPIHAALIRRSAVTAVGSFSERCFSAMDYDLWLRLLGAGARIRRVPEVLAFYRWHGDQISGNVAEQTLHAWQVRRDFVGGHRQLVAHIPGTQLRDLVHGPLLRQAYRAWWGRRPEAAARLFRAALRRGCFGAQDLRYLPLGLLPAPVIARLAAWRDQSGRGDPA